MSHYVVLMAVTAASKPVEERLEKFNETRAVEPYRTDCTCGERSAMEWREEQRVARIAALGNPDHLDIAKVRAKYGEDRAAGLEPSWEEMIAPLQALYAEIAAESKAMTWKPTCTPKDGVDYTQPPRPDDIDDDRWSACGGTGKVWTTYNPDSLWDWWVVGGRWGHRSIYLQAMGVLDGKLAESDVTPAVFKFAAELPPKGALSDEAYVHAIFSRIERYAFAEEDYGVLSQKAAKLIGAYGLIDLQDAPHMRGRMMAFGLSSDDLADAEWDSTLNAMIDAQGPEAKFMLLDFHI